MNILFIENAGHTSAGAFHALVVLADKLKEYGVNSYVALPDRADGIHLLEERQIPYITLRECSYTQMISQKASLIERIKMPFKDKAVRKAAVQLADYAIEHEIDIIHENTSACYIGKFVADITGMKHVWHIREMMEEGFGCELWNKERAIENFNKADKVIAISRAVYSKYSALIDNEKLCVVYDGVDAKKYLIENRNILENEEISILVAGRVNETKGQHVVVQGLGLLHEKYGISMKLTVAGLCDDDNRKNLLSISEKYGVSKQVNIIGQCESIKDEYSKHDILCSAAVHEGFGLVTVEGMLSGCLVIGADSGATGEILSDGAGLITTPGDAMDLAEKLKYVHEHREECRSMAKRGQIKAKENFDAGRNAKEIVDIYHLIKNKG